VGIVASLSHCIEAMLKREEFWQRKYEKEEDKRRRAEVAAHAALNGPRIKAYKYAGPDYEEGPHSTLSEEEFFDALEMAFKSEEDREVEGGGGGGAYDSSKVTTAEDRGEKGSSEENQNTPTKPESNRDEGTTEQQVIVVSHTYCPIHLNCLKSS
jgi:collagen type IV alpha-3-binding protein